MFTIPLPHICFSWTLFWTYISIVNLVEIQSSRFRWYSFVFERMRSRLVFLTIYYISLNVSVLALCLRINAWISLAALSSAYFIASWRPNSHAMIFQIQRPINSILVINYHNATLQTDVQAKVKTDIQLNARCTYRYARIYIFLHLKINIPNCIPHSIIYYICTPSNHISHTVYPNLPPCCPISHLTHLFTPNLPIPHLLPPISHLHFLCHPSYCDKSMDRKFKRHIYGNPFVSLFKES